MHSFPRPTESYLHAVKTAVARACPACASTLVAAYRVLSEGGWWDVVKCQDCLHSLARTPAPRLGAFEPFVTNAPSKAGEPTNQTTEFKEFDDVRR